MQRANARDLDEISSGLARMNNHDEAVIVEKRFYTEFTLQIYAPVH